MLSPLENLEKTVSEVVQLISRGNKALAKIVAFLDCKNHKKILNQMYSGVKQFVKGLRKSGEIENISTFDLDRLHQSKLL